MNCFIHTQSDAIAVCKLCGKAMCANCSAYSGHSGICPECRREGFIQERNALSITVKKLYHDAIAAFIVGGLLTLSAFVIGWLALVPPVFGVILGLSNLHRRKPMITRLTWLNGEIDKLTQALQIGVAVV